MKRAQNGNVCSKVNMKLNQQQRMIICPMIVFFYNPTLIMTIYLYTNKRFNNKKKSSPYLVLSIDILVLFFF